MNLYSSESEVDNMEVDMPIWQEPRRDPLGAPKESCDEPLENLFADGERLHALEEEQEILSSSVFSLTSHLAQVEFRLRQILKAPPDEKDAMLKELEEFTSRGLLNTRGEPQGRQDTAANCAECSELDRKLRKQRINQMHFIERLKLQLKELETYANDMNINNHGGSARHRTLIHHLKNELEHSLEENCHHPLTADELRHQINCTVRLYAEKQVSKDEIVSKIQAHIEDMQKFVRLTKSEELKKNFKHKSQGDSKHCDQPGTSQPKEKYKVNDDLRAETINLMRKASALIQIFTVSQFGCSPNTHRSQECKPSASVSHWGNLRARLEMSIDAVLNLASNLDLAYSNNFENYDSDDEEGGYILNNVPLTTAVRKHLAVNLKDLLQHGLRGPESASLVPMIGCFPLRRGTVLRKMHIWELILKYYDLNDGDRFNSTPARKLSQSFNLDIVGGTTISNKQSLLAAIGSIIASHAPYKRSSDAHFKAFVCAALNAHKLVIWLNLILKAKSLIDSCYSSNSYVVNTGFHDTLQSLDRLTPFNFDLPVDLAVKQFQNIKDVFM